jgi:hypothetical protein
MNRTAQVHIDNLLANRCLQTSQVPHIATQSNQSTPTHRYPSSLGSIDFLSELRTSLPCTLNPQTSYRACACQQISPDLLATTHTTQNNKEVKAETAGPSSSTCYPDQPAG